MKKIILIISLSIAIFANEYVIPTEPNEIENNKTIEGIDSNKNGIRDDVEIYIQKNYTADKKECLMKVAVVAQNMILKERTQEFLIKSINEINSIIFKYKKLFINNEEFKNAVLKIGDLTANTKERKEKSF